MKYAEVAVDAPVGHSRTFSYSIPSRFSVEPGQLVWVPFGRRVAQGVVVQLAAAPQGLPVAFVVRALLTMRDRDSILEFIQKIDHASGQNYIIGIADEVFDFEASANKVVQFQPGNDNGTVYHTNHPLVNDDIKPQHDDPSKWGENSQMRLATVESRLESNADVRTETIMEVLRSRDNAEHPVCRTHVANLGGFTFASTIMSLGEIPSLQLTVGPPDESEYRVFTFPDGR